MGEMICVCREIDKYTGEIAVYPIKAEVTDRLLFCLGLRQRANPELKYFVTLAENYDANEIEAVVPEADYGSASCGFEFSSALKKGAANNGKRKEAGQRLAVSEGA